MSYFSRLVRHAQLRIGEAPDRSSEPALDIVEVEAARDAPRILPTSPNELPALAQLEAQISGPQALSADVDAVPGPVLAETVSPTVHRPRIEPEPEAQSVADAEVLRHVLQWVRAGGEAIASDSPERHATPAEQVIAAGPPGVATPTAISGRVQEQRGARPEHPKQIAPPLQGAMHRELSAPLQSVQPALVSRSVEPSVQPAHAPAIDEIVEISIGTINVRIEPPATDDSARRARPTRGEPSPAPARREAQPPSPPRLARQYLHP